jgi:hypothetical protein
VGDITGVASLLDRFFGRRGAPASPEDGLSLRVRCKACGEVIRARVNPTAELSLADDGSETYFVRKVLVGQRCFRPIELHLRYADARGRAALGREARGGTFVEAESSEG